MRFWLISMLTYHLSKGNKKNPVYKFAVFIVMVLSLPMLLGISGIEGQIFALAFIGYLVYKGKKMEQTDN